MRYARKHNEQTREKIVATAARLFREQGIAVGLAKIMAEAGLTVGTFYTHFKSKEALVREALRRSLLVRHELLEKALRARDLEQAIRIYLSPEHRDAPGSGCPTAALAPEVARRPRPTRHTFMANLEPTFDLLVELLTARPGKHDATRAQAVALFGLLAGTLQLARATPDRAQSDAILEAGIRGALRLANVDAHSAPPPGT
jgi:TetR/AcrR family transcriptional regulator, transcriptional repressor for nem operon